MNENKTYGVISLILGILSVVLSATMILSLILGILAIIFGIIALKTTKRGMGIASIILGTFGVLISIIVAVFVVFVIFGSVVLDKDKMINENYSYQKLNVKNVQITYSDDWKLDELNLYEDENNIRKVIKNGNLKIALVVTSTKTYYTTQEFVKSVASGYEEKYDNVKVGEKTKINDQAWISVEYSYSVGKNYYHALQYFLVDDYDQYSVSYVTYEDEYLNGLEDAKKIIETVKLDTTQKELDEKEAKNAIVGEWDCGNTGYLVFNEDNTYYFYKDSTKSEDNVIIGKYTASNKVKTYAAGYAKGFYIICDVEKGIKDGEIYIKPNNRIDYVFTPDEDGTYNCKNMVTYSTFKAKKVK